MKIKSADFELSSPDLAHCPRWHLPEFAFIGRSNVGKSSLVNALTERRELAMVSSVPGKTKLLNFFRINDRWCLVDLPGYGYAKVAQQDKREFNLAVNDYIAGRDLLDCVFVLIDSRIPPQGIDLAFLEWLNTADVDFALIFTKADKQSASKTDQAVATFLATIAPIVPEPPPVFISSAHTKAGRMDILQFIADRIATAR
jgi:GTP-binding protein